MSTPNLLNQRGKLFVGGPEIIELERLLPCDQLLPDGNYPRGMIRKTWPCSVCFRVREGSKPTVINQHSVKLPGNNLLTISAVGPSVERALNLKGRSNRSISNKHWWRSVLWLLPLPPIFSSWNLEEFKSPMTIQAWSITTLLILFKTAHKAFLRLT